MTDLDNKKLCAVAIKTNSNNETYVFGQFGKSQKGSTVASLQYVEPGTDGEAVKKFWECRIGRTHREIKCIQEGIKQKSELEELAFVDSQ